jgi:hypothetical protein
LRGWGRLGGVVLGAGEGNLFSSCVVIFAMSSCGVFNNGVRSKEVDKMHLFFFCLYLYHFFFILVVG